MSRPSTSAQAIVEEIAQRGLSIYDPIAIGDPKLWIPTQDLEALLDVALRGLSVAGLPLRTRSKVIKEHVCRALGYRVPASFQRTQPRFAGQRFDTYIQKANNLQIWNEEIEPSRRYVVIRVSPNDIINRVKVVTGATLALLDTTGTLTQKYQARCVPSTTAAELLSNDTSLIAGLVASGVDSSDPTSPLLAPRIGQLLPIADLFAKLRSLVGVSFPDSGHDQERNRGAGLHRVVCAALGYSTYEDGGQFPDVPHQILEVKLQTSTTIDLGLVCPNSGETLAGHTLNGQQLRHCDVRYAVYFGRTDGENVIVTNLTVIAGEHFFRRFPQFQGNVLNRKVQIPLPSTFFDAT